MRKFDAATGERLSAALAELADPDRLAEVGDWIIECGTAAELLARVARTGVLTAVATGGPGCGPGAGVAAAAGGGADDA